MKELVDFINDNIADLNAFPLEDIHRMDDESHWKALRERWGECLDFMSIEDFDVDDEYFCFLSEPRRMLVSFSNVNELIAKLGIEEALKEECENQGIILVIDNGKSFFYDDRDSAAEYYHSEKMAHEGAERAKYANILSEIVDDLENFLMY